MSTPGAIVAASGRDINAFHQNGDSFGAEAVLGTNDAFDLTFERNNTEFFSATAAEAVWNDAAANYDFRIEGVADANLLFIDASADQVGIGTAALASGSKLTVQGSISGNSTTPLIVIGGPDAGDDLTFRATASGTDGDIIFQTDPTTERARILSTGEVVLGADAAISATERLKVQFDQNANTQVNIENGTSGTGAFSTLRVVAGGALGTAVPVGSLETFSQGFTTSGTNVQASVKLDANTSATGGLFVGTSASAPIVLYTTDAERARINDSGVTLTSSRLREAQGADVASANDLTLGADGNTFEITGVTQINAITITNWQNGSLVTLIFAGILTVKHNTAGGAGTAVILLAAGIDFITTSGDTLTLRLSEQGGTQAWREIARTVI